MIIIRKYLKISTAFLIVLFILIGFPIYGKAEESLVITRWLVDSEIVENGDLKIVEDITFKFNDKFNGVFREIILTGTDGLEGLQVAEMIKGEEVLYTHVNEARNGDSNVFTTLQKDKGINIKIFSPSKDEEKTFRLYYTIKDVAIKYNDTGELYYKFLGNENSTPIDFFAVNIKLPQPKNDKVHIFAHGPSNGTINFQQDNLIKLQIENVSNKTFIEARILFPTNFIPNSTNIIPKDAYDEIIEEELANMKEMEEKQIRKEANRKVFNNISALIAALGMAFITFTFYRLRRNIDYRELSDSSLYPDDCTPAVAAYLNYSMLNTNSIMATIFDLARKGYISIDEKGEYKKNIKNFKLTRHDKSTVPLLDHEKYFIHWLFEKIGNGDIVTTKDIENYGKENRIDFSKSYNTWHKKVKEDANKMGYFDDRGKKSGIFLIIFFILAFIFAILSVVFNAYYGIILIFVSMFALIYGVILFFRKSDYGYIQYKKWRYFIRDMKRVKDSLNIKDLSLPLDTSLIYALALGVNFNSLKNFKNLIPESNIPGHWAYWYYYTGSKGQNSFQSSLNNSFSTVTSSGSGGGFSGGGGAGAGGGGAGGF
ncbi:DUF2207 family protein [Tepidimicrobium xylanilyticum]